MQRIRKAKAVPYQLAQESREVLDHNLIDGRQLLEQLLDRRRPLGDLRRVRSRRTVQNGDGYGLIVAAVDNDLLLERTKPQLECGPPSMDPKVGRRDAELVPVLVPEGEALAALDVRGPNLKCGTPVGGWQQKLMSRIGAPDHARQTKYGKAVN